MKEVNQVLKTNDYSMFKHINGNRNINKLHLKRLTESIAEKYIEVPIIVNSNNQIIDGQHRFEAAKELGKDVYYIKVKNLNLDDVHRLNTNSKNWTAEEYMQGYCELGLEDYIKYRDFKRKYGFGHNETNAILTNRSRMSGSKNTDFNDGVFKILDYDLAVKNAEKICMVREYYEGYKRRYFVYAMLELFENPDYSHVEFLNKLSFQSVKLQDCTDVKGYLILIEDIYNFKRSKNNKVRFF